MLHCPREKRKLISMDIYVWLLHFLLVVKLILCTLTDKCYVLGNIKILLLGYRCFSDSQVYFSITATNPHLCISRCIANKPCAFVLYSIEGNYCIIANGPCLWLEPDTNYNITFIRMNPVEKCLEWFPYVEVKNAARRHDTCLPWGLQSTVGRLHIQSNILPGNSNGGAVYSVLNVDGVSHGLTDFLDVQPGCKVSWVSFTNGDPVPDGAVQGGYINNNGSPQPIYVMGAIRNGDSCTAYGYYDPATERGYIEYFGVHVCTQMYLMTEMIWFFRYLSQYSLCGRNLFCVMWKLFEIQKVLEFALWCSFSAKIDFDFE